MKKFTGVNRYTGAKHLTGAGRKKKRDQEADLEKSLILNPEKLEKEKKKKQRNRNIILVTSLLVVVCVIGVSFQTIKAIGKSNLKNKAAITVPVMEKEEIEKTLTETEKEQWKSGWVKYENQIYAYNEDILTFLFMGIDKKGDVSEVEEGTDGGQADALFLLVMNPHDKSIEIIGINRNTMADVDLYDDKGAYMKTVTAQLAVQHGFGNGMEESCEYQVEAVQKLFYNLPIHGYCAINMGAVIPLTDLVGGVELVALEDVKAILNDESGATTMWEGKEVLLDGKRAYSYVRYRDVNLAGSADRRFERQKQYLSEFIKKTKSETAKDISLPVRLYQAISEQMVTNVSLDEVTYLASVAKDYHFSDNSFYFLKGETKQGEQFEEFYIEEDALYEMILDIFYEPVEMENAGGE